MSRSAQTAVVLGILLFVVMVAAVAFRPKPPDWTPGTYPQPLGAEYPAPEDPEVVYLFYQDEFGRRSPPILVPTTPAEYNLIRFGREYRCYCGAPPAGVLWRTTQPPEIRFWCRNHHPMSYCPVPPRYRP